ncbi:hypothetical protein [Lentzea albidocapillata]|uniref:Uncharacterized protein n=1 Tax=Lentzea albidocapillata TaxID=40571 RepID=A0A1W2FRQ7_9PSEU|nr:hypothetical protein [Lentzea albidocapillata]SMD24553.1 hypothetical protein SAMN05660733_07734 [Lentzea albidocapillata]
MSESRDQQVKRVVEAMAVAVWAAGVTALTSSKVDLELRFNAAWRQWPKAGQFPGITSYHDPGNLFWLGQERSARRTGVLAAWKDDGPWKKPALLQDWPLDEFFEDMADEHVSADDWRQLGQLYVDQFKPEQLVRAD